MRRSLDIARAASRRLQIVSSFALGALGLAACGTPSTNPAPTRITFKAAACAPAIPERPPSELELAALMDQLAKLDDEIGEIDDALIAAEHATLTVKEARLLATRRKLAALAGQHRIEADANAPFLLERAAARYLEQVEHVKELSQVLGVRHPEMVQANQRLERLLADYHRQREIEIAFADAWTRELKALATNAAPKAVRAARGRALAAVGPTITREGIAPSDAPLTVIIAAMRVFELQREYDVLSVEYGPKHPGRMTIDRQLQSSRRRLDDELAVATERSLAGEQAAVVESRVVARRADLVRRARLVRQQLAALLARERS